MDGCPSCRTTLRRISYQRIAKGACYGKHSVPKNSIWGQCDWVIERTFAWMTRFRRLARDYERWPETLAGLHVLAFAVLMLHRFALVLSHTL